MATMSHATKCEKTEFAELQTMNTDELTKLYCENKKNGDSASNSAKEVMKKISDLDKELSEKGISRVRFADIYDRYHAIAKPHHENALFCSRENERVARVIKMNTKTTEDPSCP